jgi:hypothetical protein
MDGRTAGHPPLVSHAIRTLRRPVWQSPEEMQAPRPVSEVKGLWFVIGRRYVLDKHGQAVLQHCVELLGERHGAVLASPLASEWYPEETLQQTLGVLDLVIAGGDPDEFVRIVEACSLLAVNHFFRTLLRMVAPATMLRRIPTMWTLIRRGVGRVMVETSRSEALVRYSEFPYFDDVHYRLLTLGAIRALLTLCGEVDGRVEVAAHTQDTLVARVRWGEAAQALPK